MTQKKQGEKQDDQERGDTLHPGVRHVLRFFRYDHLPQNLQEVSRPFCDLAYSVASLAGAEGNPEVTVALRKLLEAKDAAVRAVLP